MFSGIGGGPVWAKQVDSGKIGCKPKKKRFSPTFVLYCIFRGKIDGNFLLLQSSTSCFYRSHGRRPVGIETDRLHNKKENTLTLHTFEMIGNCQRNVEEKQNSTHDHERNFFFLTDGSRRLETSKVVVQRCPTSSWTTFLGQTFRDLSRLMTKEKNRKKEVAQPLCIKIVLMNRRNGAMMMRYRGVSRFLFFFQQRWRRNLAHTVSSFFYYIESGRQRRWWLTRWVPWKKPWKWTPEIFHRPGGSYHAIYRNDDPAQGTFFFFFHFPDHF